MVVTIDEEELVMFKEQSLQNVEMEYWLMVGWSELRMTDGREREKKRKRIFTILAGTGSNRR
jgi:hypothetical protein